MIERDTILIVDDMEINRAILRGLLESEYNLLEAENGEQAMVLAEEYQNNIAAILLDLIMPVKDGYQVMSELGQRNMLSKLPVIVITAEDSADNEVRAFDLGASDIIRKPFEPHAVKRRVQNIVELNIRKLNQQEIIEEQAAKLRESNAVMIDALSSIIEYRSVETGQHIQRIRMFTRILLEDVARSYPEFCLNERKIAIIVSASSMHDIGKIAIPDSILNKPGRLTSEEFEIMKTHTSKGCEMLANLDRMSDREYLLYAYNICRYHHERWDGRGYPDGLKGDAIPICAQVVGIADCYDALTTDRVYKKAIPPERASNMILNGECGVFSMKLLECFKNVRPTFAKLSNEYADGRVPRVEAIKPTVPVLEFEDDALDTLQMGQTKYFTLLRYVNSTVMEVDLNSGVCHMVYDAGGDFDMSKSGGSFEEYIRAFVNESVHPEDREMVLDLLGSYMREFLDEGLMKRSRRYRVYNESSQSYLWYRATLLRVDTNNPHQHKVIVVWEAEGQACEDLARGAQHSAMQSKDVFAFNVLSGILTCRNDRWLTLLSMNDCLRNMLGYTEGEIESRFKGRYIDLIYSEDREVVLKQTKEQLRAGDMIELEYRLIDKNNGLIWVLEKSRIMEEAGDEYLLCLLIDITRSKKAQEELRFTLERHKAIMEQSNDIVFEWDIARDYVTYSDNWEKKFGYKPIDEKASVRIPTTSHVHPEELPRFTRMIEDMRAGVSYAEMEFRLADANGRYRWCKIRAIAQFDSQGRPYKAIGALNDIDEEKRLSQLLRDEAERDGLTRLYNKSSSRRLIEGWLKTAAESSAMLIMDVDDFKQINDGFGHMFGDVVLQKVAEEIRQRFSSHDIVSRIGGDEFMIFMRNISGAAVVEAKAAELIEAFKVIFDSEGIECRPSCSIGIAFCPGDGQDFEALFQCSDMALYHAKAQGKGRYAVFDAGKMDLSFGMSNARMAANTRIESDDALEDVMNSLMGRVFGKIYSSKDMDVAINDILRIVGEKFDVSRAYIFEDSEDGLKCSNTFEWCNEGVEPQKSKLVNYDYGILGGRGEYTRLFNEEGIFYCPDIHELSGRMYELMDDQSIKSLLQYEIRDENGFRGFVGFDECRLKRFWTKEQIDMLAFMARLLSIFLLKKRAQDKAVSTVRNLHVILDNQDALVYIIDPETYQVRYINAKTRSLSPDAREGMLCYEVFFGFDRPCKDCPLHDESNQPKEMYNPVLKVWASVSTSLIQWEGKPLNLMTCQDITKYKQREVI